MGYELNYRTSTQKDEIIKNLSRIEIDNLPVVIWQNIKGKRIIAKFKIKFLDFKKNTITFTPIGSDDIKNLEQMNDTKTVYLKGHQNHIVFKQDVSFINQATEDITIPIPMLIKLIENRAFPRQVLDPTLPPKFAQVEATSSNQLNSKIFFGTLENFSVKGMAFSLDKKYARLFFENEKIKISGIGKLELKRPIFGTIRYLSDHPVRKTHQICGVEFSINLPSEALTRI